MVVFILVTLLLIATPAVNPWDAGCEAASHAISLTGSPRYKADFTHFDYVNPDAPKGGTLRDCAIGTFDSFNPYILKGTPAEGTGLLYDTLLVKSDDEPSTYYGLVAESMDYAEDFSWVVFYLNKNACFQDNTRITADDVIFSYKMLTENFGNVLKRYYADIRLVEKIDSGTVRFSFRVSGNRELPVIVGQLPVIPMHFWADKTFSKADLTIPTGSGPYRIGDFTPGRSVVFERVKNYWARDLPVMKGRYNFDRIRYDYYRDNTIALEAFKAGLYDYRFENSAKNWVNMYYGPLFENGSIKKVEIPHNLPGGMHGLVFNTRRPVFKDANVRRALMYAFDYEWANKRLYYGQYKRLNSYFFNCELQSTGLPKGDELQIINRFRERLPEELFSRPYRVPETDGSGQCRANLKYALKLLKEAGWTIKKRRLVNTETGKAFRFQFLSDSPEGETLILPFRKNLSRLGIEMQILRVDSPQYTLRLRRYDYDMIIAGFGADLCPGNEQKIFWHSENAMRADGRNLAGVSDFVVDRLVEMVIAAKKRNKLVSSVKALDRVLLWGNYVIPFGASNVYRLAHTKKIKRPATAPGLAPGISCWWSNRGAACLRRPDL